MPTKKSGTKKKVQREIEKAVKKLPVKVKITVFLVLAVALVAFLLYWNFFVDPVSNWYRFFAQREVDIELEKAEGDLRVHFVDVGQGDAIVLELPDDKVMVIDGGPREAKFKILEYLRGLKIDTIDYLVLTHGDEDHVGSLDDVVLNFNVKNIFMPGMSTSQITTNVYKQFNEAVNKEISSIGAVKNVSLDESDVNGGSYLLDFYCVDDAFYRKVNSKSSAEKKNAVSPLIFLTYAERTVLFTGDANFETEELFLERQEVKSSAASFDVDVLKVGHHGSETSSGEDFLDVVRPEHSVIMCGEGNKYGHPRQAALDRLNAVSEKYNGTAEDIYRTDTQGDIVLTISDDGNLVFSTEKGETVSGVSYVRVRIRSNVNFAEILDGIFVGTRRKIA